MIQNQDACTLCVSNGRLKVIPETNTMLLIEQRNSAGEVVAGRWLVLPREHCETLAELPLGWGEALTELVTATNCKSDYNLSLNIGRKAGQRVSHLHWWVIDRTTDGLEIGLAALIDQVFDRALKNAKTTVFRSAN